MAFLAEGLGLLVAAIVVLIAAVAARPAALATRRGKMLAFLAFFVLPSLATGLGLAVHLEQSKSTEFCLSCHVMEPYGHSLAIDDGDYLPAVHYQNNWVPRERACFTCHTTYTMFGDLRAKLQGLKHVYVNYLGTVPDPIALYQPYHNRECLSCHGGARRFEESEMHSDDRAALASGEISCLDCHGPAHAVGELEELPRFGETGDE